MIVKVLSENTASSEKLGSEHGLSFYIETENHKILFDTGASGLFAENAEKMGVDLTRIDLAVLSHGHYDHGGGLKTFLDINKKAKIYLHQKAFGPYYASRPGSNKAYIGLDRSLLPNERFVFCGDRFIIDDELVLFSGIGSPKHLPSGNVDLLMKDGDAFVRDDFAHEQNLIISENGKTLLVAGCAHTGIVNIIDQFYAEKGCLPDYVIGGFHLYSNGTKQSEAPHVVIEIGHILLKTGARFYTCHCTGIEPYHHLKTVMGEKIGYISTGDQLTINRENVGNNQRRKRH
ncbi:MAG: MBL fold metallo-hydrolase [Christensenellales bacterium]|jgi:7,8-dihydropterin-6-yl-methyl-4-(beta-D-ribofuranosyl)aminobenzene 5'-phosphate synthase